MSKNGYDLAVKNLENNLNFLENYSINGDYKNKTISVKAKSNNGLINFNSILDLKGPKFLAVNFF